MIINVEQKISTQSRKLCVSASLLWTFLAKLTEKAAARNPDEFYHKMQKSRMVEGEHKLLEQKKKRADEKNDLALVGLKRIIEKKKGDKL